MVKTVNVPFVRVFSEVQTLAAGICLFDVDNGDTGAGCEEWGWDWRYQNAVNDDVLVPLLLALSILCTVFWGVYCWL